MNARALHVLEYDKILELLRAHLSSDVGREAAGSLAPAASLAEAERLLQLTEEADGVYRRTGRTPIDAFPDIRPMLARVHAAHALTAAELLDAAQCLRAARAARETLLGGEASGLLAAMAGRLSSHRAIEEEIGRCILAEDEIADSASPELMRLRRQMRLTNERMREKLNAMIKSPVYQKYLQEPIITVRNGRLALPVKAEHRAQVSGLVHDQSGSGATLFIEPAAAVELGNELRRLQAEERVEIGRILAGLTALLDPVADELYASLNVLGALDVIFAKAVLARDMRAVRPKLNAEMRIRILAGRHPLLPRDTVVPVDVWLGQEFRTLIITGPNTGGKTVTLKTVGLFTLMAMSGLFVPADARTELAVCDEVFADIGDEQSIEQSLSTFSSHMTNTVAILREAGPGCLVLLDELGAGTDPVEGAALAQAILEALYASGALTMATTHYSEIKAFALTRPGMQNASMEFDVDRLLPTYRLFIGIPGKSNAFEISERLGLAPAVIERARQFLQKRDVAFEDVLSGAEAARREAETAAAEAEADRRAVREAREQLERQRDELAAERAQLRQKAREEARRIVQQTRQEMEDVVAKLRAAGEGAALERAVQQARDAVRAAQERVQEQAQSAGDGGAPPSAVKPGDAVRVLSVGREATVLKPPDARGEVLVQAGAMRMSVKLADLRSVQKKPERPRPAAVRRTLAEPERSFLSLDLRGRMVDEATVEIDRFIDDAELAGVKEITLIHGKGTGALRAGVQAYLRTHPQVKSFRIGAYGEGDAGVTVVTLR
ncbi:MAG TPA: endonuclease MutS2 [Candidatus Aphodomorpha intestinavium]|uniref:Endonuclease MutS2 n=1 Tax=Candidatus Aphodomorpha intestinavium TaxID=2840672 RepID=A0A9D1STT7_9FIRM|nr:endonuclease MutS2 [Candidatus Aphodomorpha intestinavium]